MSFLNLSQNLTRLRKEKKITQEELAEFVGVTKASVSKWETGATTPDIQILPVLAAFFDVSVDELLGYEAQLTKKQIQYLYHDLAKKFAEREFAEAWKESQELVKKYYGCYPFLLQMAVLYLNHSSLAKSEEQKAEVLMQAEKLCVRILEGSRESGLIEKAAAFRAIIWLQQGRADRVIEALGEEILDVNQVGDKGDLLTLAYLSAGDPGMAEKSSQIGIYRNLMELIDQSVYLLMSVPHDKEYCRKILNRTDEMIPNFQIEELQPNAVAGYQYQAAVVLCGFYEKDQQESASENVSELEEEIYQRIEKYVQMVCKLVKDGKKLHADAFFYRLEDWFENLELGTKGVRNDKIILADTIASLRHPAFAVLQNHSRMPDASKNFRSYKIQSYALVWNSYFPSGHRQEPKLP